VQNQFLRWLIVVSTVAAILILAFLALGKGPAELTALAAVLAAGAGLLASAANIDK
jgi:hypothetical protein